MINIYKKILLGVDNSEHSMKAIEKALEIQKRDNSEVVIFHSVLHKLSDIRPTFAGLNINAGESLNYEIHEDRVKDASTLLEKIKKKFENSSAKVETRLTYDIGPQYYIEKKVKEENYDLVILGCQGEHSKLRRTILGTVPEYVLNHVESDVLVIK